MGKKKEEYSTERAWGATETTNPQADVFHSLADGLRRENLLIKKMLDEKEKKLTEQEIYIEQLEKKIESLTEQNNTLKGHLDGMCTQADEDCPTEYRTGHFEDALFFARDYLEELEK